MPMYFVKFLLYLIIYSCMMSFDDSYIRKIAAQQGELINQEAACGTLMFDGASSKPM